MTYRPHRSHAHYAPVVESLAAAHRRRPRRAMPAAMLFPAGEPSPPAVFVGLVCALPPALLLWAGLYEAARVLF